MEKNNNQETIINIAIELLNIPITKKDIGILGVVYHPFFNNTFLPIDGELIDITKDKEKFYKYKKQLEEHIRSLETTYKIMTLINRPYKMFFFSLIINYLDEKDFAILLKECYTETEFPNRDVNVSVEEMKNMFSMANINFIMDNEELSVFNSFDNELLIYRGFYSDNYYNALSWTLDKKVATMFATRFKNKGCIYTANIRKEDVYAYFDCRNEKELIVNYDKLYNITKKEQFK